MLSAAERAAAANELRGSLSEFDCPLCLNRGYITKARGDALVASECECMARRKNIRRIKASGLEALLKNYTFDAFQGASAWQRGAKAKAMEFAEHPDGKWFICMGSPGTGKTHLCTAIAGELMARGRDSRYMLWRTEATRLKSLVTDAEEYQRELGKYKVVPVLYIDDLFKGKTTEADVNLALELIGERYNRIGCVTIISTEKTLEDLLEIDEALGSRIYERAKNYAIKMGQGNWRLR